MRSYRLPDGQITDDVIAYADAWTALATPLEREFGWTVIGYDPSVQFDAGTLPTDKVRAIASVIRERDEARSAWQSERCLRLSAESERDAARLHAEGLRAALNEVDSDYLMSETQMTAALKDAYRRGAEAMREACATLAETSNAVRGRVNPDVLRAMPIPEDKP